MLTHKRGSMVTSLFVMAAVTLQAREELAERLYQGWKAAWEQTRKHGLKQITVRSILLLLLPKDTDGFRVSDLEAIVTGENQNSFDERVRAAYVLSWRKRCVTFRNWRVSYRASRTTMSVRCIG